MSCKHIPIPPNTTYGRLTILDLPTKRSASGDIMYAAQCSCNSPINYYYQNKLRNGNVISCGCYRREATAKRSIGNKFTKKDK